MYEPLCAWLSMQLHGHLIKLDVPREETFVSTRVRHAIKSHIISWVRPDGTFAARKLEAFSDQGAYASHGHSICAKGVGAFPQLYPCDNVEADAYTIFTNKSVAGAMRGYGIPQAMWAVECHTEDICAKLNMDPLEFRRKNLMPVGYKDAFSKNELYKELKLLITFVNTKNTRTRQEISAEVSVWQSSGTTQLYGQSHLRHLPAVWY